MASRWILPRVSRSAAASPTPHVRPSMPDRACQTEHCQAEPDAHVARVDRRARADARMRLATREAMHATHQQQATREKGAPEIRCVESHWGCEDSH